MTAVHAIMVVIIRLWAADAIFGALLYLPTNAVLAFTDVGDGGALSITYLVGSFGWLIVGVIAWFVSPWLARRIYIVESKSDVTSNVDAMSLVAIGSFLIGIYYLAQYGFPLVIEWGSWMAERMGESPVEEEQLSSLRRNTSILDWRDLISKTLTALAACVMTFRPSYLARIFVWLRSAGQYKEAEEKP